MVHRERASIAFRLPFRGDHGGRPAARSALRSTTPHAPGRGLAEQIEVLFAGFRSAPVCVRLLLCFEDERPPAIAVDPTEIRRAIAVVGEDAAFENVVVLRIIRLAAIRRRNTDQIAKAVDETLRIGELGPPVSRQAAMNASTVSALWSITYEWPE
jgi:hypothetical protein